MATTSHLGLAPGRWTVDAAHSRATFHVGNFGRAVTGTVPIIDGTVDIDRDGQPWAINGSLGTAGTSPTARKQPAAVILPVRHGLISPSVQL